MADSVDLTPPPPSVFQRFLSQDGEPLHSVQTHAVGRFGDICVYWSDIQDTIADVCYLLDNRGERVLFEIIQKYGNHEL